MASIFNKSKVIKPFIKTVSFQNSLLYNNLINKTFMKFQSNKIISNNFCRFSTQISKKDGNSKYSKDDIDILSEYYDNHTSTNDNKISQSNTKKEEYTSKFIHEIKSQSNGESEENIFDPFIFDDILVENFKFKHLCYVLQLIESNSSRTKKVEIISLFFRMIVNIEYQNNIFLGKIIQIILPELQIIENSLEDEYNEYKIKFQYAFESIIKKYIYDEYNITNDDINSVYDENINLHEIIYSNFKNKPSMKFEDCLSIDDIVETKIEILNAIGSGSIKEKLVMVKNLYEKCSTKEEARFLTKLLLNKLNIGIGTKAVITALELMAPEKLSKKDNKNYYINMMYYLQNDIFRYNFSKILIEHDFRCGKFFNMCLAKPNLTYEDYVGKLNVEKHSKILVETKYDGERTQLHYSKKDNMLLLGSRNYEDQSKLYIKLHEKLKKQLDSIPEIENIILDGEITLYDTKLKQFSQFQELRKKEVPNHLVHFLVAFDILYYNDKNIYELDLDVRKKLLSKLLFNKAQNIVVEAGVEFNILDEKSIDLIKSEYYYAKNIGCEGLIIKQLGANTNYHFGKRYWNKMKNISHASTDTLDLVPIGASFGSGNKSNLFATFLLGYYNKQTKKYISICKVGTGLTMEELAKYYKEFYLDISPKKPDNVVIDNKIKVNFFFKPRKVWEIRFDCFVQSNFYYALAGLISDVSNIGVSLRFPRFVRERPDKSPENATSTEELYDIYEKNKNSNIVYDFPNFNEAEESELDENTENAKTKEKKKITSNKKVNVRKTKKKQIRNESEDQSGDISEEEEE